MEYKQCYKLLFMDLEKELKKQVKLSNKYSELWYNGGTLFKGKHHYREKMYIADAIIIHIKKRINSGA